MKKVGGGYQWAVAVPSRRAGPRIALAGRCALAGLLVARLRPRLVCIYSVYVNASSTGSYILTRDEKVTWRSGPVSKKSFRNRFARMSE